jgi:hypothetical protein
MPLLTVEYRPDVAAIFGTTGLNGFRVRIPLEIIPDSNIDISVLSETGEHLKDSPLRVGRDSLPRPTRSHRTPHECVLFMHIQKTSGTAFREAISANFSRSECLYVYPMPPGIWHEEFHKIPAQQIRNCKCIAGHFVFGLDRKLAAPCVYTTIVRDPVARVASHYDHMIRNESEEIRSQSGGKLSLHEVLEARMSAELDNLIVRCFSGRGARHCPPGMIGPDAYEAAVENLEHFRFVGHQERSEEGWRRMQRMFDWRNGSLERVNVGRARNGEFDRRTRMAIEHHCKFDIMLHRRILSRWPV